MPQPTAISDQWVTCPGCNTTSLRATEDIQRYQKSWWDTAWMPCGPECIPKTQKRQRWGLIGAAVAPLCLTASSAVNVYPTLACGAALSATEWFLLALLPVIWGCFGFQFWQHWRARKALAEMSIATGAVPR